MGVTHEPPFRHNVLQAYFDASQRPGGTFCIAGYAFAKPQVKKFDREWWDVFGPYGGCHMKELTQRRGRFQNINNEQAGELLKKGVKVIRRRMSFGVSLSCDVNELKSLLPTWIDGFQGAYPVCCTLAMQMLGSLVRKSGHNDEIEYFLEKGDEYAGAAHKFMSMASVVPELKDAYLYGSHTFIDKDKALALQSADVLAWECAKYWDETVIKDIRKMRLSLVNLLLDNRQYDAKRYHLNYVTGPPLWRWAEKVTALGLLELQEQAGRKGLPSAS